MPYTLKTQQISVKDPDSGEYIGVDVLAEQNKESLIAEIQSEGDLQVERVDQKAAEILAAGDAQVTRINQTGTNVQTLVNQEEARAQQIVTDAQTSLNTLEAQKNAIAETVASMAELGTDTTLTTPGMAADAKAVGDVKGEVDNLGDFVYDQDSGLSTKAPAITDSASSGDIVTFESDVEGGLVSKLTGTIEPIQDLHGYDYPWPAGGGANMLGGVALGNAIVNAVNNQTYAYLGSDSAGDYVSFTASGEISGKVFISGVFKENTRYTFIYRMKKNTENGLAPNINVVYKDGTWTALTALSSPATTIQTIAFVTDVNKSVDYFELGNGSATSTLYYDYSGIFEGALTVNQFSPYSNICPIAGYTEANVSATGTNAWDEEWELGYISPTGQNEDNTSYFRSKNYIPVKPSTQYYFKCPNTYSAYARFRFYDQNKTFVSQVGTSMYMNAAFTTPANAYYMRFVTGENIGVGVTYNHDISINYPSTDTAYHAYTGSTIPVSFPTEAGTVYSGTINPISGKLVVDYKMYELDGTETGWIKHSTQTVYNTDICRDLLSTGQTIYGFSSHVSTDSNGAIDSNYLVHSNAGVGVEFRKLIDYWGLLDNEVATWTSYLAQQKTAGTPIQILGKLKTPIEYQCTTAEVKTLLGTNNIWLDTGTITECVYPKDTKKYIDNKSVVKAPVIINHAEGEIASFTDGAEDMPVKSLVASIEPVQDLHGYDNPWPAGGGKNLLHIDGLIDGIIANVRYTSDDNYIYANGTKDGVGYATFTSVALTLPAGTYHTRAFTSGSASRTVAIYLFDGTNNIVSIPSGDSDTTFTLTAETTIWPRFAIWSDGTVFTNYKVGIVISNSDIDKFYTYANVCPISGHTGMTVTRTGANVWDEEWENGTFNTTTGANINTGAAANQIRAKNLIPIKPSATYYFKDPSGIWCIFYDANKNVIIPPSYNGNVIACDGNSLFLGDSARPASVTFTMPSNAYFMKFYCQNVYGSTYNHDISINYPSTDTAYHAYTGTTVPITWETKTGTVYGGTVTLNQDGSIDIWSEYAIENLGSVNWGSDTNRPGVWMTGDFRPIFDFFNRDHVKLLICDQYKTTLDGVNYMHSGEISSAPSYYGGNVIVKDERFVDLTAAQVKTLLDGVQCAMPLKDKQTYHFSNIAELTTLLGTNNIWTDAGSVSVDYSADTKLFIQNAIAEALSNSSNP